jgi:hypothetical protein
VTAKISSAKKSHPAHSNRRSHSNSRNKRDSAAASVIERIAPGHPAQNGRHERMHLTLKTDATRPAAHNVLRNKCASTPSDIASTTNGCQIPGQG